MQDPAIRSQEFAQRANARAESYIIGQGDAVRQGIHDTIGAFQQNRQIAMQQQQLQMQQQQLALEDMVARSRVASQEADRQRAQEELLWARELHTTDMLEAQKKLTKAQADFEIAKLARETEKLGAQEVQMGRMRPDDVLAMQAQGFDVAFQSGRPVVVEAAPDVKTKAQREIQTRENRQRWRSPLEAAYAGEVWDQKIGDWKQDDQGAEQVIARALRARNVNSSESTKMRVQNEALDDVKQKWIKQRNDADLILSNTKANKAQKAEASEKRDAAVKELEKVYAAQIELLRRSGVDLSAPAGSPVPGSDDDDDLSTEEMLRQIGDMISR